MKCNLCGGEHANPKDCPCRCSYCGGEKDALGWCANYCDDYDPLMDDVTDPEAYILVPER